MKRSTAVLFAIFGIAAIGIGIYYLISQNKEGANGSTGIKTLADVDTLALDSWKMIPNGDESSTYGYTKTKDGWMLVMPDNKLAQPDPDVLRRSLTHISRLVPASYVGDDESKFSDYGVGDGGNILQVYEGDELKHELIIGRLEFVDQNMAHYYVRRKNSNDVYLVQHYLEGSLLAPVNKSRWPRMAPIIPQAIQSLRFISAAGTDYFIERKGDKVMIDDKEVDMQKLMEYLSRIHNLQIKEFAKAPETGAELAVEINSGPVMPPVSLRASRNKAGNWILSSTINKGNFMEVPAARISDYFPPASYFLNSSNK